MRNLQPFPHESFQVLEDAVNRKIDQVSRDALTTAFSTIRARFTEYDQLFNANSLETIAENDVHAGLKAELLGMYSYDNAAVSTLRRQLELLQPNSVRYTCQYCSLETAEEMDHVVGKDEFPEFSIHPKNLIP
ncbi:MAG: phage-related protein, partial [Daejeonella sp.]|nr:phage-related protein [Daejeonella sp.]